MQTTDGRKNTGGDGGLGRERRARRMRAGRERQVYGGDGVFTQGLAGSRLGAARILAAQRCASGPNQGLPRRTSRLRTALHAPSPLFLLVRLSSTRPSPGRPTIVHSHWSQRPRQLRGQHHGRVLASASASASAAAFPFLARGPDAGVADRHVKRAAQLIGIVKIPQPASVCPRRDPRLGRRLGSKVPDTRTRRFDDDLVAAVLAVLADGARGSALAFASRQRPAVTQPRCCITSPIGRGTVAADRPVRRSNGTSIIGQGASRNRPGRMRVDDAALRMTCQREREPARPLAAHSDRLIADGFRRPWRIPAKRLLVGVTGLKALRSTRRASARTACPMYFQLCIAPVTRGGLALLHQHGSCFEMLVGGKRAWCSR